MDVIDQAQQDLARGEMDRARQRLLAALQTSPASQPILELLAYTHLLMGDRAAAGAAWFLTAKSDRDPTASSAFAALEERHRSPMAIARAIPINAPSEHYPPRAQARLERLANAVRANGQEWVPPRDTVYFDDEGVDADDFGDDELPDLDGGRREGPPMRQRVVASIIILAIAATSASVVLAIVFS
ncbi:MAG: DUF6584 family protein [Rhodococcus sp. (in: high G+C Gram-positive bacteria)]